MATMLALAVELPMEVTDEARRRIEDALRALYGVTRVESLVWDTRSFESADLTIGVGENGRVEFLAANGKLRRRE